jgi:hypothetical protein
MTWALLVHSVLLATGLDLYRGTGGIDPANHIYLSVAIT